MSIVWSASAQQKADASSDEAALRAIEEKWNAANLNGDAAALEAIFADTFVMTDGEGKVRPKAEVIRELKSGNVKYQAAKSDELQIYIYGDAAVVTGRWRGKFTARGKTTEVVERFTDTFVKQNGAWRCVASHGSNIKQP
jgi:uncharacterized protein (TIGR02246 family)